MKMNQREDVIEECASLLDKKADEIISRSESFRGQGKLGIADRLLSEARSVRAHAIDIRALTAAPPETVGRGDKSITVYKDGSHKLWSTMDACYAANEPDWLVNIDAGTLAAVPAETTGREWRCFHCDETFTTKETARMHFGSDESCEPACKIDIAEYRRLEEQQRACLAECCAEAKRYYAAEDDRRRALVAAEQKGYDKGVTDARATPPVDLLYGPEGDQDAAMDRAGEAMGAVGRGGVNKPRGDTGET